VHINDGYLKLFMHRPGGPVTPAPHARAGEDSGINGSGIEKVALFAGLPTGAVSVIGHAESTSALSPRGRPVRTSARRCNASPPLLVESHPGVLRLG